MYHKNPDHGLQRNAHNRPLHVRVPASAEPRRWDTGEESMPVEGTPDTERHKLCIRCKRWRYKDNRCICTGFRYSIGNAVINRDVQMLRPTFTGSYACDHFGAIFQHLLGVKRSFTTCDPLYDYAGIFI